jgi:Protein of unknown function (DUF664)
VPLTRARAGTGPRLPGGTPAFRTQNVLKGTDWEFTSAADDTPEQLYDLWDGAVERSRERLNAALANGGLDQSVHWASPDGRHASLRRLVCDLIEEYGRHTGHADLIRERQRCAVLRSPD